MRVTSGTGSTTAVFRTRAKILHHGFESIRISASRGDILRKEHRQLPRKFSTRRIVVREPLGRRKAVRESRSEAAAQAVAEKYGTDPPPLYGIVNNAGLGSREGAGGTKGEGQECLSNSF